MVQGGCHSVCMPPRRPRGPISPHPALNMQPGTVHPPGEGTRRSVVLLLPASTLQAPPRFRMSPCRRELLDAPGGAVGAFPMLVESHKDAAMPDRR